MRISRVSCHARLRFRPIVARRAGRSNGTQTTLVVVEIEASGALGLGYSYADALSLTSSGLC
jgi:hypothetical protein